jgi:hypothetical protein
MTKRRPKTESAIVHASSANTNQEVYAALVEQLLEAEGPDSVARFLAGLLRLPAPHPDVLAMVARWLDPQADDHIKLVVVARRSGNRMTKRVNDATIARVAIEYRQSLDNKQGSLKAAVSATADRFGVSQPTVRKAMRSFNAGAPPSDAFSSRSFKWIRIR